jgi:hypothetical protein
MATRYFTYNTRPVKVVEAADHALRAWALDWETGGWQPANELVYEVIGAPSPDVFELTPEDFVDAVEAERGARLAGDGPVFALYETVNAILAAAAVQDREPTREERALIRGVRRRTYGMFEEELRRRGDPAVDPELASG